MLVHLTCFSLKNFLWGCYWGGSWGNPCHQIVNFSFFSCFLISTRDIISGPCRCTRRQVSLRCALTNVRPSIAFLKRVSCCNFLGVFLVPDSGRRSLSFSILIKLLHTPSTLILAHSYFCLGDSLNSVPRALCSPNLRRQTGLWSWWGVLRAPPLRIKRYHCLLLMHLYHYTRKYVSTRTKPKPHTMNDTENVSMRDVLVEISPPSLIRGHICNGKWEAGEKVQLFFLCRSQDGFPRQIISDSFTVPPRFLQSTENSVWKRNRRYAGHNDGSVIPNAGSECPRPEKRVMKLRLSIPTAPVPFPGCICCCETIACNQIYCTHPRE